MSSGVGSRASMGTLSPAVRGVPSWRQKAVVSVLRWTEAGTSGFFECQNHRKASAGASGLGTRHKGRGNQLLWLLAFAVLTACSVKSLLILCQCFVGSILRALSLCDVPPQSPSYISGYKLSHHMPLYSHFLWCHIFTAYGSRSCKKSIWILGWRLPLSRIPRKLWILENGCPLVRNSLPAGGKV